MITNIPTKEIVPWVMNPRKRIDAKSLQPLVDSMRSVGWFGAIMVRPVEAGGYQVLAGERRWRAAGVVGLEEIACEVRAMSDKEAIELAVIENRDREDLDVIEEAGGYRAMVDLGWSVAEICSRSGRSEGFIYSKLQLLDLDEAVQEALRDELIAEQTALALGRVEDEAARADALQRIVKPRVQDHPLTVRQALELIQEEYLRPQKRQKAWEKRCQELRKAHGAELEILSMAEAGKVTRPGSEYVRCDVRVPYYLLAAHVRDDEEFEAPKWGELAEKHGARKVAAPDADGNAVFYVLSEPLVTAEKVAGEADPKTCIFPLTGTMQRHEQSVARQQTWAEQQQEQRESAAGMEKRQAAVVERLRTALIGQERLDDDGRENLMLRMMEALNDYDLLEGVASVPVALGVDLETLGTGDELSGLRIWLRRMVDLDPAADVMAFLLLARGVVDLWSMADIAPDAVERMEKALYVGHEEKPETGDSKPEEEATVVSDEQLAADNEAWLAASEEMRNELFAAADRALDGTGSIVFQVEGRAVEQKYGDAGLRALRSCLVSDELDAHRGDHPERRAKRAQRWLVMISGEIGKSSAGKGKRKKGGKA